MGMLKIESDGTPFRTIITDMETGKPVGLVQKVVWECDIQKQTATAVLTIANVPVEVIGEGAVSEK